MAQGASDAPLVSAGGATKTTGVHVAPEMRRKLLAGLALATIAVTGVGAALSLAGALDATAAVATFALVALAMVGVVATGLGGAGERGRRRTPYW